MSRDRLAVCEHYICFGQCELGRDADQNGYCQKCNKFKPLKGSKRIVRELKHKYKEKRYNYD